MPIATIGLTDEFSEFNFPQINDNQMLFYFKLQRDDRVQQ